jgi:bacterioferritin
MTTTNLSERPATQNASGQQAPAQRDPNGSQNGQPEGQRLKLDETAIEAAKGQIEEGAVTPAYGPWRDDIVALLNGALATELLCVLRYKRHYFTVDGVSGAAIKDEFLVHANEESAHADLLAERIVQLGGLPDFSPDGLSQRSHADYNESTDLMEMVRSNLVAERVAIETYRQMISLVGDKDPTTRRILEEILSQEEEHADDLKDWLHR